MLIMSMLVILLHRYIEIWKHLLPIKGKDLKTEVKIHKYLVIMSLTASNLPCKAEIE